MDHPTVPDWPTGSPFPLLATSAFTQRPLVVYMPGERTFRGEKGCRSVIYKRPFKSYMWHIKTMKDILKFFKW